MTTTNHCIKRMNQRAISRDMIELVLEFGEYVHDHIVLSKKRLKQLLKSEHSCHSTLVKMLDKGGVTVVVSDDALVTAYRCNYNEMHRFVM